RRMLSVKKISVETTIDIYQEGFSDGKYPFLFYAATNDILYKYYLDKKVKETIDLKKDMKIDRVGRYYVIFNKENYIVSYQSVKIYNSVTQTIYDLDSLTNHNGMEYSTVYNNTNSWKHNKILLTNLLTCDVYNKPTSDSQGTVITCERLNKRKSAYSAFAFKHNKVNLSTITFKDINPETKSNSAEPCLNASAIYINTGVL